MKVYRIRRFLALFQIVLVLTIFISQFTFEIFAADAAYKQAGDIKNNSYLNIEITNEAQQYTYQNISSTVLAKSWIKSTLRTLSDFLSLGANTAREAQEASRVAGGEARETLQQLTNDLNTLITTVSDKYKDNLNVTINSLDEFTKEMINEATVSIEKFNNLIQEDIRLISSEAQAVVRTSSQEIQQVTRQLEESFKGTIIVGAESTAYVIDRTAYNGVIFLSLGMLGAGLLLFIWLLFTDALPVGIARTLVFILGAVYISVFGSMALLPSVRAYAMIYSGIGLDKTLKKYDKASPVQENSAPVINTSESPVQENNTDIKSEVGAEAQLKELEQLLKQGDFKAADEKTIKIMLYVANREKEGGIDSDSMAKFSCTDLRTIDQLWVNNSNGRFGFSVQKRLWEENGKDWEKWWEAIGWTSGGKWKSYDDLTFAKNAKKGHLPRVSGGPPPEGVGGGESGDVDRVEEVLLSSRCL